MKRILCSTLSILLISVLSCSDRKADTTPFIPQEPTEVSGVVSGLWDDANSPYIVTGDLLVPAGETLTIEPGCEIQFGYNLRLTVNGRISAIGLADENIRFVAGTEHWRGIHIINSSAVSTFSHCLIDGGSSDVQLDTTGNGILSVRNATVNVDHCIFRGNQGFNGGGIAVLNNAVATVGNCIFRENRALVYGGAIFVYQASATIINNTIYNNWSDNIGGGVVLFNPLAVNIQNNIFYRNSASQGLPAIYFARPDSGNAIVAYNMTENDRDPAFIHDNNLRLAAHSPAKDAGNPDPAFNDVDGTRNDQGAYGGPGGIW